jgi:hypothetical protein
MNKMAMGQEWPTKAFVSDGHITQIYIEDKEIVAVEILDELGSRYCTEFFIFTGSDDVVSSDGWWTVFPPAYPGNTLYFVGNDKEMIVNHCHWICPVPNPAMGYWRITAVFKDNRKTGIEAASWMFGNHLKSMKESACYQVEQAYYPMPGQEKTIYSSHQLPCYKTQEDAIAFLEAATFPGRITQHTTRYGLVKIVPIDSVGMDLKPPVVYQKTEGNFDYVKSRHDSAKLINKANRKLAGRVLPQQSYQHTVGQIKQYL